MGTRQLSHQKAKASTSWRIDSGEPIHGLTLTSPEIEFDLTNLACAVGRLGTDDAGVGIGVVDKCRLNIAPTPMHLFATEEHVVNHIVVCVRAPVVVGATR
eukprot:gene11286-3325_t